MRSLAKQAMQDDIHDDGVVYLTYVQADGAETYSMSVYETTILISAGHTSNTLTLTLPPVSKAKGKLYSIRQVLVTGSGITTLEDLGDDAAFTSLSLDETADHVLLYSDGYQWIAVFNNLSA